MKRRRQIPRWTVLESVGQMQLQKGDEIGEHSRMASRGVQRELVEVEYETLHVLHVVIGLAADFAYLVVRHIDHSQIRQAVQSAEHVPRQFLQLISRKDKHLISRKKKIQRYAMYITSP